MGTCMGTWPRGLRRFERSDVTCQCRLGLRCDGNGSPRRLHVRRLEWGERRVGFRVRRVELGLELLGVEFWLKLGIEFGKLGRGFKLGIEYRLGL